MLSPNAKCVFAYRPNWMQSYFAINHNVGFAIPMFIGTVVGSISVVFALLLSPETKGKILVSDLVVA